jgi:CheY-like chemotaxis protein
MPNVMVVDDDLLVLDVMVHLLENLGHKVWRAGNATEALALLGGPGHFDLVLLDVVMPVISGLELAKLIRARFPSIPMIAMSGYIGDDSTSVVSALHGAGVREILRKPIDRPALNNAVSAVLRPQR